MDDKQLEVIKGKISTLHEGDEKQLSVIFAEDDRVIVEAPAGFGKTTTMVSRIAYLYASGKIPNPKRMLGLTFSVNAALKIKRDIAAKLPMLLQRLNNPLSLSDKMTVTNYHGFCKAMLRKYGRLRSDLLRKDINLFCAIGDEDILKQQELRDLFVSSELTLIGEINEKIRNGRMPVEAEVHRYNQLIISKLLPINYVTHNAVILFAIELLDTHQSVKKFYSNYYPLIIVDEFQDTNCISWELLKKLINSQTQLLFLGDPLQRIYGFIGALPALMDDAEELYNMRKITLCKNYRFRNNVDMLRLDANIRKNAVNGFKDELYELAKIPAFWADSQISESFQIVSKIKKIKDDKPNVKIAVLFRNRNDGVTIIEEQLNNECIDYFYGMFTDEDIEYVRYHQFCQKTLLQELGNSRFVNARSLKHFADVVKQRYTPENEKMLSSLNKLLDALVQKIAIDYGDLQAEEKFEFLMDIFENRQLKQAMEYVDSSIILSTIHGAKGLEWDYVFIADLEIWGLPSSFTCKGCDLKFDNTNVSKCIFPKVSNAEFKEQLLDELSVFYVATTRAKKQVYFSASKSRANGKAGKFSCFASMPGIKLIDAMSSEV